MPDRSAGLGRRRDRDYSPEAELFQRVRACQGRRSWALAARASTSYRCVARRYGI